MYFEWSEKGLHKEKIKSSHFYDGFNRLVTSKRYRGITIHELWEPGINDGIGLIDIVDDSMPRSVVDFIKKEMFEGKIYYLIEKVYRMNLSQNVIQ